MSETQQPERPPVAARHERGNLNGAWQRRWFGLHVTHPLLQDHADDAARYARAWFERDRKTPLLVMCGPTGRGKTMLSRGVYQWAFNATHAAYESGKWGVRRVPSVMFCSWPETTDGFKEGRYEIMADLFDVDLLVMDDIGAEHDPSKNAADKLCQVLSRRETMFTVVTTNIAVAQWQERFDTRIADRLLRRSLVLDFSKIPSYSTL